MASAPMWKTVSYTHLLALAQQLDGLLVVSSVPVVTHELTVVVHVRLDGAALDGADVLAQQFTDAAHIAAHVDLQQLGPVSYTHLDVYKRQP